MLPRLTTSEKIGDIIFGATNLDVDGIIAVASGLAVGATVSKAIINSSHERLAPKIAVPVALGMGVFAGAATLLGAESIVEPFYGKMVDRRSDNVIAVAV